MLFHRIISISDKLAATREKRPAAVIIYTIVQTGPKILYFSKNMLRIIVIVIYYYCLLSVGGFRGLLKIVNLPRFRPGFTSTGVRSKLDEVCSNIALISRKVTIVHETLV